MRVPSMSQKSGYDARRMLLSRGLGLPDFSISSPCSYLWKRFALESTTCFRRELLFQLHLLAFVFLRLHVAERSCGRFAYLKEYGYQTSQECALPVLYRGFLRSFFILLL